MGRRSSWNGDSLVGTIWRYDEGGHGYELFFASFDTVVCTEFGWEEIGDSPNREYVAAYRYDPPEVSVAWNGWEDVEMTDTGAVDPVGGAMVFDEKHAPERIYYKQ